MILELTLPWPPTVNHYKKVGRIMKTRSGKIYQQRINSPETTAYFYQVYMRAKQQVPAEWLEHAKSETLWFDIQIKLSPPHKRRYDLDNPLKVLLDSLVHAQVIKDDSQIVKLLVEKDPIIKGGQVFLK